MISATADQMFLRHHPERSSCASAIHRRNGTDQPLRRVADIAGVSEALAAQGRVAGRCGRESVRCGGSGWARGLIRMDRLNNAWTLVMGGAIPRPRRRHSDAAGL